MSQHLNDKHLNDAGHWRLCPAEVGFVTSQSALSLTTVHILPQLPPLRQPARPLSRLTTPLLAYTIRSSPTPSPLALNNT